MKKLLFMMAAAAVISIHCSNAVAKIIPNIGEIDQQVLIAVQSGKKFKLPLLQAQAMTQELIAEFQENSTASAKNDFWKDDLYLEEQANLRSAFITEIGSLENPSIIGVGQVDQILLVGSLLRQINAFILLGGSDRDTLVVLRNHFSELLLNYAKARPPRPHEPKTEDIQPSYLVEMVEFEDGGHAYGLQLLFNDKTLLTKNVIEIPAELPEKELDGVFLVRGGDLYNLGPPKWLAEILEKHEKLQLVLIEENSVSGTQKKVLEYKTERGLQPRVIAPDEKTIVPSGFCLLRLRHGENFVTFAQWPIESIFNENSFSSVNRVAIQSALAKVK